MVDSAAQLHARSPGDPLPSDEGGDPKWDQPHADDLVEHCRNLSPDDPVPLLSICVMAYGRTSELARCLASIDCGVGDSAEILVLEDASPTQPWALGYIDELAQARSSPVRLLGGRTNIGFDRSIARALRRARGRYVLLISDDDVFEPGALRQLLRRLEGLDCGLVITGFWSVPERQKRRARSLAIPAGAHGLLDARLLYDCVLFSGLVFERQTAMRLVSDTLAQSLYSQVHLGLLATFERGAQYLDLCLVRFVADGPNFFGRTSSTLHRPLLVDRQDWRARFAYHEGLFAACREVGRSLPPSDILRRFSHEYLRRSLLPLARLGKASTGERREFIAGLEALVGRRCRTARLVDILGSRVSRRGTLALLAVAAWAARWTLRLRAR